MLPAPIGCHIFSSCSAHTSSREDKVWPAFTFSPAGCRAQKLRSWVSARSAAEKVAAPSSPSPSTMHGHRPPPDSKGPPCSADTLAELLIKLLIILRVGDKVEYGAEGVVMLLILQVGDEGGNWAEGVAMRDVGLLMSGSAQRLSEPFPRLGTEQFLCGVWWWWP